MSVTRKDPLPVFCFQVVFTDLKDVDPNYFKSVSGLRSETEVIPVRAGGANATTYNLVGAIKWSPLVLKQGFTVSTKLLDWRESWVKGPFGTGKKPYRSNGSILQLDTALNAVAVWEFKNAWPSKWELGDFDASKNELQIESLEIVHEGLFYSMTKSGLEGKGKAR